MNKTDQGEGWTRRIVIKFGGSSLSGEGDLDRFSNDIATLLTKGIQPVIVHGGGPEITQEMERRGLKVRKVSGLRITDDATLEVARAVLATINAQIVTSLQRAGVAAVGMSASEHGTVQCTKMPPVKVKDEGGKEMLVDLGKVGDVDTVDPTTIENLTASGSVPVIYPICRAVEGGLMNVNADTVAAHIAKAIGSEEMVLVTDVPGILREGDKGKCVVHDTTLCEIDSLIASGVISGGMLPKVEACRVALVNGVRVAYMLNGKEPHSIVRKIIQGEDCGTRIEK